MIAAAGFFVSGAGAFAADGFSPALAGLPFSTASLGVGSLRGGGLLGRDGGAGEGDCEDEQHGADDHADETSDGVEFIPPANRGGL